MNKKFLSLCALALFAGVVGNAAACTFSWYHYGDNAVYKRIQEQIGSTVTNEYCAKYNKGHEIVIITSNYTNTQEALGHAVVGLRKRGTKDVPLSHRSSYRSEQGNFVIGQGHALATLAAIDSLMDLMSNLDGYAPK